MKESISRISKELKELSDLAVEGEKEYLEKLSAMYGTGKDDFLKKVEKDILSEKVQKLIGQSLKTWITEEKMNYKITIF